MVSLFNTINIDLLRDYCFVIGGSTGISLTLASGRPHGLGVNTAFRHLLTASMRSM